MVRVRFFTREACELCEQALEVVEQELARALGAPILCFAPRTCGPRSIVRRVEYAEGSLLEVFDIDGDPRLKEKYMFSVPVVEVEGGATLEIDIRAEKLVAALKLEEAKARG